jgi:hypothetical protein
MHDMKDQLAPEDRGMVLGEPGYTTVTDVLEPVAPDYATRQAWEAEGNVGGSVQTDTAGLTPKQRDAYFNGQNPEDFGP